MPENCIFVSSELFDRWVTAGAADLDGDRLRARASGASYVVEEAVHVLAEVSGGGDAPELVGRVRRVRELSPLGAELLDRSMVMGDLAYDVVPGFLVSPFGSRGRAPSAEVLAALGALSRATERAPPPAPATAIATASSTQSDEDLLARYLIDKL